MWSDAQSDGSAAGPASDTNAVDNPPLPTTAATATMTGRQHKPAAEYFKVPPAPPGPPQTPLSTASVSQCQWGPREAETGGILCSPASWAMACHCSVRDTPCYSGRGCPMVKRGGRPYLPMGWPIILGCWHISQPRRGLVVQGLFPSVRGLSLCRRPLWQIYCCSKPLERQPCHHGVSIKWGP